jgi:integrase
MPRHRRGDGTTIQRGEQWWAVVPARPGPDGQRRRLWRKASPNTEAGAEQTRRRLLIEAATAPPPVARVTVGAWLDSWLARRTPDIRPNTRRYAAKAIDALAPLHAIWLDALTPARVQAWVDEHAATHSPHTVKGRLNVLRAALTLAVDLELITRNPAARVRSPRIVSAERPILTADQARALLALVDDTPWAAVFGVALALGLRRGEALALRWSDIDLDGGWLTVQRQAQNRYDGTVDVAAPVKTRASRRVVPLPAPLADLLRRHRDRQRLARGRLSEYVSPGRYEAPFHPDSVREVWLRYRARIDAPAGMTFHDLRHSAASLLAAQGIHPSIAAGVLGHATISQTAAYTHADRAGLVAASEAMARALNG